MLTPPYHHSIVACPLTYPIPSQTPPETLYRGALPAKRNLPFLERLHVRTLLYLRKYPLGPDDPVVAWADGRGVELRWVKAEEMSEEKLGMGRGEVGEVLRIMMNRASYPLYICDVDGKSHTTLVVACLRKLQGWHIDSIIGEMCRFEPEYEDFPLVSFITQYLSTSSSSSDTSFALPPPPYPSWLWPSTGPLLSLTKTWTRERAPSSSTATTSSLLPFPNPLSARKHPTMKITFPQGVGGGGGGSGGGAGMGISGMPLSPTMTNGQNPLSRTNTRADWPASSTGTTSGVTSGTVAEQENRPAPAVLSSTVFPPALGLNGVSTTPPGPNDSEESATAPSSVPMSARGDSSGILSPLGSSPEHNILSRQMTMESQEVDDAGVREDVELDDDDYDDDDDDEEEDEDEDEEVQPTSQYISALDLAGY